MKSVKRLTRLKNYITHLKCLEIYYEDITKFFTPLCYATKIVLKFYTLIRLKQHECFHCERKKCIFPQIDSSVNHVCKNIKMNTTKPQLFLVALKKFS